MAQLTVRDVPEDVLNKLKEDAQEKHTSVNSIVLAALNAYAADIRRREDMAAALEEADALRERIRRRLGHDMVPESWVLLREDRDAR